MTQIKHQKKTSVILITAGHYENTLIQMQKKNRFQLKVTNKLELFFRTRGRC